MSFNQHITPNHVDCPLHKKPGAIQMAYKGIAISSLSLLVMACAACGGGGGSGSNPAPVQQTVQPKPVQVSLYGDSTMAGTQFINGSYVVTKVLRADLQTNLQAALGSTVTVVENDQYGTSIGDLLQGVQGFYPFSTYMQNDKSPIVVENFAINDMATYSGAQFQQNLNQFIALAQAAGKKVVLEEPNPVCAKGSTTDQEQIYANGKTIGAFVTIIDATAQQYGLPLIKQYEQIKAMPNWCTLMSDGGAHPTAALYQIKAQNQAAVLDPIVKSLQ